MLDYFAVLKTPAITASGRPKDRFHFTYPTEVWDEMSNSGVRWAMASPGRAAPAPRRACGR
jgi:hypothetical protein